jgi:hypothetical protein
MGQDVTSKRTWLTTVCEYRGIRIKVAHPPTEGCGHWCYYVYLFLDRFEDEKLRKSVWVPKRTFDRLPGMKPLVVWNYSGCDWFDALDFHCGVTFYEKHISAAGDRMVEVGCDFGHLWDDDKHFTLESVLWEAKVTVDAIHATTTYLVMCQGNGRLVKESEIMPGRQYSRGYVRDQQAEGKWLDLDPDEQEATPCEPQS